MPGLLFVQKMFNALNCTSEVLGRKLLLVHVSSKPKLMCVCVCVCDFEEEIYYTYGPESIKSS